MTARPIPPISSRPGDVMTRILVHLAPVLDRASQHFLGDIAPEMADDVVDQAFAGGVIEHLAYPRASLAKVVARQPRWRSFSACPSWCQAGTPPRGCTC